MDVQKCERALVWYRRDLRIRDHAPLQVAVNTAAEVFGVVVLDPREEVIRPETGFSRLGALARRFRAEAIRDLAEAWQARGGTLVVVRGLPEEVLPQLMTRYGARTVHATREWGPEERDVESALRAQLGDRLCLHEGQLLVDPADLPVRFERLPTQFTPFRHILERSGPPVRAPLEAPRYLPGPAELSGPVGLENLEPDRAWPHDPRTLAPLRGGESAAWERLGAWIWRDDRLARYHETRDGLLDPDDASRFSPYLAWGCLSARQIVAEVRRYEAERVSNRSTTWLVFELWWRDFFHLRLRATGVRAFAPDGPAGVPVPWSHDRGRFERWLSGETGYPLVDAAMRELAASGHLSNRGRQVVASFLVQHLGIDWRWGAWAFQGWLVDHDVASNWGNWAYLAGVGADPRGARVFNPVKQARDHDPDGAYVRHWLPELAGFSSEALFEPWLHGGPSPLVDHLEAAREARERYEAVRRLRAHP
jgi:deoxyribodipyrimidine photo-lyase